MHTKKRRQYAILSMKKKISDTSTLLVDATMSCPSVLHSVPWAMNTTSYKTEVDIIILYFYKKEGFKKKKKTWETNQNEIISSYSPGKCCK